MKAILINPKTKEIKDIEMEDCIHEMHRLIECETFCQGGWVTDMNMAWVDDEGLRKVMDDDTLNVVAWYPQALVGNILITGMSQWGESIDTTLTAKEVEYMVKFVPALHFFKRSRVH